MQVLFTKLLLSFNLYETRFRFIYGALSALAANAIQVELVPVKEFRNLISVAFSSEGE